MIINLNRISIKGLQLEEELEFSKEYYQTTGIINLSKVKISGEIRKDINQDYLLELVASGVMTLEDARTLEPIEYPFSFEINEKIDDYNENIGEYFEKSKNTLDIMGILWENIVLEVPMRLTNLSDDFEKSGKGWELVSEKVEKTDPRLAPLGKLLEIEKE